jgi:uncharacterized damage-inducible protein DinB
MSLDLLRGLYDYHWWANRRLSEHAAGLGEEMAGREVGPQFSYPTVRRMLTHIYGADALWLARWTGNSPTDSPGADIASLADLRERWAPLEAEQRAFLDAMTPADLARMVEYKTIDGKPFRAMLGLLLQHVANHATHHRSEVATMVTMLTGPPPESGLVMYELIRSGQIRP